MSWPVVGSWYTPAKIVDAAREVMGGIDLDPASCAEANKVVRATIYWNKDNDGLKQLWLGRVWLNSPTDTIARFADKLLYEWRNCNIAQAVVFTHNETHADWWQELSQHASAICMPAGRVTHWRPGANGTTETFDPPWGQSIFYFGGETGLFNLQFHKFGTVWTI